MGFFYNHTFSIILFLSIFISELFFYQEFKERLSTIIFGRFIVNPRHVFVIGFLSSGYKILLCISIFILCFIFVKYLIMKHNKFESKILSPLFKFYILISLISGMLISGVTYIELNSVIKNVIQLSSYIFFTTMLFFISIFLFLSGVFINLPILNKKEK